MNMKRHHLHRTKTASKWALFSPISRTIIIVFNSPLMLSIPCLWAAGTTPRSAVMWLECSRDKVHFTAFFSIILEGLDGILSSSRLSALIVSFYIILPSSILMKFSLERVLHLDLHSICSFLVLEDENDLGVVKPYIFFDLMGVLSQWRPNMPGIVSRLEFVFTM